MRESCHIVHKAIPFYDAVLNRTIRPISPNGFRMVYYLSDVFPRAKQFDVLVVTRDDYIPVNNKAGKPIETPQTAMRALSEKNRRRLEEVGAILLGEASATDMVEVRVIREDDV